MTGIDNPRTAGLRRGASTGLRLSIACGPVATKLSRLGFRADGLGMNHTDRPLGPETMR